jgi:hypothetical protein
MIIDAVHMAVLLARIAMRAAQGREAISARSLQRSFKGDAILSTYGAVTSGMNRNPRPYPSASLAAFK